MRDETRGRLLLLTAAFLWSTGGLFAKSPSLAEIPELYRGPVSACYRALFAAACLVPFVKRRDIRWRPGLVPMSCLFAVMNLLFLSAMAKTTAAAAIFLQSTGTAWVFLFGILALKERVDRGNLAALIMALVGIGWIVVSAQGTTATGNWLALGSGVTYAGVVISLRLLRDESSAWMIALNHLVACLVVLPWVLTLPFSMQPLQWVTIAAMGSLQMGLPYVLFAKGLRYVKVQDAALIALIEPVLNPVLVWLFWREVVPPATIVGGLFIVSGLLIRTLLPTAKVEDAVDE